jgi:hypothetical protein
MLTNKIGDFTGKNGDLSKNIGSNHVEMIFKGLVLWENINVKIAPSFLRVFP